MNEEHLRFCASPEWARLVEETLLPWAFDGCPVGEPVLEIGPGPGLTTDVLARLAPSLVAVELDGELARKLRGRLAAGVAVVRGDATRLPLASASFATVTCFTMLHHVPTAELQDRLLAEVARVLRPGGTFVGLDGTDTPERRALHLDDVFVPVDPDRLAGRLRAAGLGGVEVVGRVDRFRFRAAAPPEPVGGSAQESDRLPTRSP